MINDQWSTAAITFLDCNATTNVILPILIITMIVTR